MKSLLLAAALTLTAAPVMAENSAIGVICSVYHDLGEQVMKSRQNGMSMKKQYEVAGDSSDMRLMVESAYTRPRFHTKAMKSREVEEFANAAYLGCVTKMNRKEVK